MPNFVLDTSVIVKWFNQQNEQDVKISHQIYYDMIDEKIYVLAPDLLVAELLNVFIKGKKLPNQEIKNNMRNLFSLPLILKEPTPELIDQTTDLAKAYRLSSYDALFLALAKVENCQLISDDSKAHGRVTDGSVVMLSQYQTP